MIKTNLFCVTAPRQLTKSVPTIKVTLINIVKNDALLWGQFDLKQTLAGAVE
jgi:hypothetical protein